MFVIGVTTCFDECNCGCMTLWGQRSSALLFSSDGLTSELQPLGLIGRSDSLWLSGSRNKMEFFFFLKTTTKTFGLSNCVSWQWKLPKMPKGHASIQHSRSYRNHSGSIDRGQYFCSGPSNSSHFWPSDQQVDTCDEKAFYVCKFQKTRF